MLCSKCAHANDCVMFQFSGTEPPITICYKFKKKQQTNADRIRAMTDEELAEYLTEKFLYSAPQKMREDKDVVKEIYDTTLDWLKQEADDED